MRSAWLFKKENHSSPIWKTFLYRNLLPDNGSVLSVKVLLLNEIMEALTPPHSEDSFSLARDRWRRGGADRKVGFLVQRAVTKPSQILKCYHMLRSHRRVAATFWMLPPSLPLRFLLPSPGHCSHFSIGSNGKSPSNYKAWN